MPPPRSRSPQFPTPKPRSELLWWAVVTGFALLGLGLARQSGLTQSGQLKLLVHALIASVFGSCAGTFVGAVAGVVAALRGGGINAAAERLTQIASALPGLLTAALLARFVPALGPWVVPLVLFAWRAGIALRVVRTSVMLATTDPHWQSSLALGASPLQAFNRHERPRLMRLVATLGFSGSVLNLGLIASLHYLQLPGLAALSAADAQVASLQPTGWLTLAVLATGVGLALEGLWRSLRSNPGEPVR